MTDNYIKVHVTHRVTHRDATVTSELHPHPRPLGELARRRIENARAELATQEVRSNYHEMDAQSVTSWVFPFSSDDEQSIEQARLAAHEQATELTQLGMHPRLTLFKSIKSLSMPLIGALRLAREAA